MVRFVKLLKSSVARSPQPSWKAFTLRCGPAGVVPEMRSAVARACNASEVTSFVEDIGRDVGPEGDDTLGLLKGAAAQIWPHRFSALRQALVPEAVGPIRDNFLALMGRRVRLLNLSASQGRAALLRARDFRLALRSFRSTEPARLVRVRVRGASVSSFHGKRSRQTQL